MTLETTKLYCICGTADDWPDYKISDKQESTI